jgi:hypothetical protein
MKAERGRRRREAPKNRMRARAARPCGAAARGVRSRQQPAADSQQQEQPTAACSAAYLPPRFFIVGFLRSRELTGVTSTSSSSAMYSSA